ncbi:peptidyl-prolyl cis-trans isomerase Fkbp12-like [Brevipalpus obovatus]|uniref:peptidyl-prolyl cis-trans isomerase Fkbp12-like n=1 Tax=Brevipalpus obovatus TaxID=246614 RepID=UPI003D9EE3FD
MSVKIEKVKPGDGQSKPTVGKWVLVHFDGFLDDAATTRFDSSRTRGEPLKFELGKGEILKCWDDAIAAMSKGEFIKMTCPPEAAYGSKGKPGQIPPNSTLVFEIELIDFEP